MRLPLHADGSQLIVGAGNQVLLYEGSSGKIIKSLGGHTGQVFAVAYAPDGKIFASGDREKHVIVWTSEGKGKLKYTHSTSVQCIAFNPVTNALASCACEDFGLWVHGQPAVNKTQVPSKILCADWSSDGQRLALGLQNGTVLLVDSTGAETKRIQRSAPIWGLAFNPSTDLAVDTLAVGCWDGTLSFYQRNGWQDGKDLALGFDPCSVQFVSQGKYILVSGSNRRAVLFTREGVKLGDLPKTSDWVWCARHRPGGRSSHQHTIASGTAAGEVRVETASFSYVHGLWEDRYAFRESMTDVVVQHLVTQQRMRLTCKALVKRIALYRNRLAVQLPDAINVYHIAPSAAVAEGDDAGGDEVGLTGDVTDPTDMRYKPLYRIERAVECSLLVVASQHVVLCQDRRLQLLSLSTGRTEREWVLAANVRYIKVVGGPPGGEALLVGLKSGECLTVYVDNPFPVTVAQLDKRHGGARCLDISTSRKRLAVVDDAGALHVFDTASKEVVWEPDTNPQPSSSGAAPPGSVRVNSAVFSSVADDVLCYSGANKLFVKTADFPVHAQPMRGFVMGMRRSLVFVLHHVTVRTVDVALSGSMQRFIDRDDLDRAYSLAALGVTDQDWRSLGGAALRALRFDVASRAFTRVRDTRYLELCERLQRMVESHVRGGSKTAGAAEGNLAGAEVPRTVQAEVAAEASAYEADFDTAASELVEAGLAARAVDVFTDLRMWGKAREVAEGAADVDVTELALIQARTAEQNGDYAAAAGIFMSAGQVEEALRLWGDHGMLAELSAVVAETEPSGKANKHVLRRAATILAAAGLPGVAGARTALDKLGDKRGVLRLLVDLALWDEAVAELCRQSGRKVRGLHATGPAPAGLASRVLQEASGGGGGGVSEAADSYELAQEVWVPLGRHLAGEGRFDTARLAFAVAGRSDLAASLLRSLADNAVAENRFADAAREIWRLADAIARIPSAGGRAPHASASAASGAGASLGAASAASAAVSKEEAATRRRLSAQLRWRGDILLAFAAVHEFARAPFTPASPSALLHASALVLNAIAAGEMTPEPPVAALRVVGAAASDAVDSPSPEGSLRVPRGVSQTDSLYTLAKTAVGLGAFRSARAALETLSGRVLPPAWRDAVDRAALTVQAYPADDRLEVQRMCYRCGSLNPVLGARGDACANCGCGFHRSMASFETLPVVEFEPEPPLTVEDALSLMREAELGISDADRAAAGGTVAAGGVQSLDIGSAAAAAAAAAGKDVFHAWLASAEISRLPGSAPLLVPKAILAKQPLNQVVVVAEPDGRRRLLRVMVPSASVAPCPGCRHLFHEDELVMALLQGGCPACSYKGPIDGSARAEAGSSPIAPASGASGAAEGIDETSL